jgi:hypothetical protein
VTGVQTCALPILSAEWIFRKSLENFLRKSKINYMKKLRIWFRVVWSDYPYWRVLYKDGKRTTLLYWREANGLAQVFNGKLIIDYTVEL